MPRQIETYRVYFHTAPQYNWDAFIDLRHGGNWVGRLMFMKEGEAMPENRVLGGAYILHYPVKHFDTIVTMLREEKPLYINLNTANGIGTFSTSSEPAGEEEGL